MNRRTAYLTVPWCLIVWFSVVFLGQHHAIDVLGGAAVAVATWLFMNQLVVPHVKALAERCPAPAGWDRGEASAGEAYTLISNSKKAR